MKILNYLSEFIFKVRLPGELTPMLAIKAVVITSLDAEQHSVVYVQLLKFYSLLQWVPGNPG